MNKFSRLKVLGDGNCLYHAFSKASGIQLTPQQLRDMIAHVTSQSSKYTEMLRDDWKDVNPDLNLDGLDVSRHVRETKEWGTNAILHLLALNFRLCIIVYKKIDRSYYAQKFPYDWDMPDDFECVKTIYLVNEGNHFDALLRNLRNTNDLKMLMGLVGAVVLALVL